MVCIIRLGKAGYSESKCNAVHCTVQMLTWVLGNIQQHGPLMMTLVYTHIVHHQPLACYLCLLYLHCVPPAF